MARRRISSRRINSMRRRNSRGTKKQFVRDAKTSNRNRSKRVINSRGRIKKPQWGDKYDVTKVNPTGDFVTRRHPTTSDEVISRTFNSDGSSNYESLKRSEWMRREGIPTAKKSYNPPNRNRNIVAKQTSGIPRRRKRVIRNTSLKRGKR